MESDTPRTDANVINVEYETREPDGEPSQVIEEVVLVDFARQLERELAAERATSASLLRTIALIREAGKFTREDLDALPDAVKAMREQRDEARREACLWALPQGVVWNEAMIARAKAIAAERGWDCFAEKEGGGA